MTTLPEIPPHVEVALTMILEYLYAEEQKDYEKEPSTSHIFNSLRIVAEWIGWNPA